MAADRTDLNDLAARMPGKVKELSEMYGQWAARCGVVPPPHLPKGKPASQPASGESRQTETTRDRE